MIKRVLNPIVYATKLKIKELLGQPIKPKMIEFDITKFCNSHCKHCDIWKGEKKGNDLTFKEIEKAFTDPFLNEVESIVITGGEATLRNDLVDIYVLLHKTCPKARLQLSTNAILPKRSLNIVKEVLKRGIALDVGISLDGIGKEHDEIRGTPGNFESVNYLVDELNLLKKQYPELNICLGMTISDLNVSRYAPLKQYIASKGTDIAYAWFEQTPYYCNENKDLGITTKNTRGIVELMEDTPRKEMWLKDIEGKSIHYKCYALKNFFVIKYNGDITPCLHYYDVPAGNIKEQSIKAILTGEKARQIRKTIVKNCKGCLNSWAFTISGISQLTPYISYYLRHPTALVKELKRTQ